MNDSKSPTHARYLVVIVTFLMAVLLYLDRFCVTFTQQFIKEDLRLTEFQFSVFLSMFFGAYALGQVPSGWLSDRFGARQMLTIYILVWSAFTALHGVTGGFVSLLVFRIGIGLGQAGAYPTSAGLVKNWIPLAGRGKANSFIAFGGRLGGSFIAPVLTVYLVVTFASSSTSPKLTSDDLLNVHYLSFELANAKGSADDPPKARVQSRIFGDLSSGAQRAIRTYANKYGAAGGEIGEKYDPKIGRNLKAKQSSVALILDEFNDLIENGKVYHAKDFGEIKLGREIKQLVKQKVQSPTDQQRLNRLLLEVIFPHAIRKLYVHGWRKVMFVYGAVGLIVAALFWFCFRDRPRDHPFCNLAEVDVIESGKPPKPLDKIGAVPWKSILRSRSLWLMCVNQFGGNVGWIFLMSHLPAYLLDVHSVPFVERGWMSAAPPTVGWIGLFLGGLVTDWTVTRFGVRRRTIPVAFGRYVAMLAYLCVLFAPSAWTVIAALCVMAMSNDFCNPASWAYKQDVGGKYVGAIHGWANMWGNLGACISPVLLIRVKENFGWNAMFITGAIAFFIAGTAALGVDARKPIVSPDD